MSRTPPGVADDGGYVMSYFRIDSEALHLAVSDDGYEWTALNGDEAVLRSGLGAESIRDPFLYADGERYHLLGTDGWHSDHLVHAASPDLVSWSDPELVPVMADVPGTWNVWAPECYFDREAGAHRLLWSSTVDDDPVDRPVSGLPDDLDHRIWAAETTDFREFSEPSVFLDPGYNVIDATVSFHEGTYYLAVKDERGANDLDTEHKNVRIGASERGSGPFTPLSDPVTPAPIEGPTLYRAGGEWLMLYDHFLEDRYGGSRSADGETWTELAPGELSIPDGVRHASVTTVPAGTWTALRDAEW